MLTGKNSSLLVIIYNLNVFMTNYNNADYKHRWQARREGDRNMRAGLIPSRALQERRILLERKEKEKPDEDNISTSVGLLVWLKNSLVLISLISQSSISLSHITSSCVSYIINVYILLYIAADICIDQCCTKSAVTEVTEVDVRSILTEFFSRFAYFYQN